MYILVLLIISVLSFFKISDKISDFILKQRKYISVFIYVLCFLSFIFLIDLNTAHQTWEISISLLWFLLWLPILSKVLNFKLATSLMLFRKEIWILMWVMAFVHSLQYFIDEYSYKIWEKWFWILWWQLSSYAWWFLALIITIVLTITSNKYSVKLLWWKKWKLLHRTVYLLIIFVLLHVAFLKIGGAGFSFLTFFTVFIPFVFYFFWKTLEWKNIKLDLKKILNAKK